ncbi:uncharacterized protein PODANS_3_5650 [Podospora anserina S mat+]|uniref:Podospora anserina S mat+ genomic DNA chromosome 3, supercontig 2 n=1 Tax=Podospora anserina (strain S / ATCC MYA-4624 / DSM 980 / FGSC 10383) TaxID=515849 RepID=B2B0H2_PODAN|nr:uncharacterized protein PODANS_3_5650 [Podospora anserina S mat+]CAP70494.1 unnamed protein product [Podospora anserina S mat+]CDP27083.1 Putative protein of unknown function [Podospora anserina S mat+]
MKFTATTALLTLLTTATALPWSFKSAGNGKHSDEITYVSLPLTLYHPFLTSGNSLHLTLDKGTTTAHHRPPKSKSEEMKIIMGMSDVCLRVCWPESPKCPEEWSPKNMGSDEDPCWTCCRKMEHDL